MNGNEANHWVAEVDSVTRAAETLTRLLCELAQNTLSGVQNWTGIPAILRLGAV